MKSLLVASIAFINLAAATQKTFIQACNYCPPLSDCVTLDYHTVDDNPNNDICHGNYCNPDLNKDKSFKYISYATKCRFTMTANWHEVRIGEQVGYGDCPGLKNIKGVRADDDHTAWCWSLAIIPFSINCRNRIVLEWDGCLSCGDKPTWCDKGDECGTGCCDKNSHICSTPENSDCV